MEKYGHFSEDGLEFVITRPDTPAPWVNYISNGRYTGIISNTAGGYSFYISPRDNRITRWRYNSLPIDRPGRYIYLRDREDGEYWSPTWQPTLTRLDFYECRHGMGYTKIKARYKNIQSEIVYFVPLDDDLEVWRVTLTNKGSKIKNFDIFSFVELCLGHSLVDLINQPNDQHFSMVRFDEEDNTIYATKRYWVLYSGPTVRQANQAWNKYVFFASSLKVIGFDGCKEKFIGKYRSEANPEVVEKGKCLNTEITSGDAVAVLQNQITLKPKQETTFTIILGVADSESYKKVASTLIKKYTKIGNVDAEFLRLKNYWRNFLCSTVVHTPDPNFNLMINVWNKRQTWVTFHMARNAGYYHGGLLFGAGYRDSCQDLLGPLISNAKITLERIEELAAHQFSDGSTLHCFYRVAGGGEKTGHSDTPLWLPLSIIAYLKETGNFGFLERKLKYEDKGEGPILEHLLKAINYVLSNLTPRNLPRFGPGDWNDTLDYVGREGKGESVWVAEFLCFILKETIELLTYIGKDDLALKYQKEYDRVAKAVNEICWDGAWYIRGTKDRGGVIGSSQNEEGKIFLNAQSWAVISGVARGERAIKCMDSARRYLSTPKGPKILHPPYTQADPTVGLATRCVPGKKENGAIFNHAASWTVLAECLLGRGDQAFEYYEKIMPMHLASDPDLFKLEPYVYCEYTTSPDHPTYGEASHSWLTGTAVWMLRVGLDYILGVRPNFNGLLIDPCIPKDWEKYMVKRTFRGAVYEISVENPEHASKGVKRVKIDGKEYPSNILPIFPAGETHRIIVTMG